MTVTRVSVPTSVGANALPLAFPILASAARTANPNDIEFAVEGAANLLVVINPTTHTATPAVTVTIRGVMGDGTEYDILSSAAITDANTVPVTLQIGATIATVTNKACNFVLPKTVHIHCEHGDGDSLTYSIEGTLAP